MNVKYTQFDWQEIKINGELKPIGIALIKGIKTMIRVKCYTDEDGIKFVKNPYNKNYIALSECDK